MADIRPDDKGFSEETCTRCGWRMGQTPLNCMNDDTPHRFPSQAAHDQRLRDDTLRVVQSALREYGSGPVDLVQRMRAGNGDNDD